MESFKSTPSIKKTWNKRVIVRILRFWVQKDLTGREGLEMILIDEWGNQIQASVSFGNKRKFMPLLREGDINMIQNFQVMDNKPNFQMAKVDHLYMLGFGLATQIEQPDEGFEILENGFNFIPFTDIPTHDPTFFLDVLGEVMTHTINIDWVEMRTGKASKCDITLADADGTQVTCVLWGSLAEELKTFMENKLAEDKEPVMVALQFAKISTFRGQIKVSSMKNASKFFICPDIKEVKDFILRGYMRIYNSGFGNFIFKQKLMKVTVDSGLK
ncbi:replication protein A 70 kDa DNA-binding subunit D-like isoform X2 [Salvia miltiorrhiza]|uniref:replication protein A 70 kDa DNA-binding subunit D-like isoform X2 n=1 Tax=Salvia miltiorrhiza TaxID=226208 RepID=UPI0025AC8A9E|nr:replication protein A 70 kDa DNA-binding subunit D-like isoform X2 [Salvia miltiorrhiza]